MIKVDLHYRSDSRGPIEALLRAIKELAEFGILLNDRRDREPSPEEGKVIASQQFLLTPQILKGPSPIVLLERADAAISWCRLETKHSNVKQVLKIATLQPADLNNYCWGRYHSSILDSKTKEPCRVVLSTTDLAKIKPGVGYGAYSIMKRWLEKPFSLSNTRENVIHFAGTVDYGDRKEITNHRNRALKEIRKIPGKHITVEGRHIPRDKYDSTMTQSKIVVSPWGFGEAAYRDYEAMYAGCVLIKPDSSFVKTWPPIFVNGVTYIPCDPSWKDLAEKVAYVLDSWDELEGMRAQNYELLKTHWKPKVIAKYYASIFKEALHA
jgi:hypothetical protein